MSHLSAPRAGVCLGGIARAAALGLLAQAVLAGAAAAAPLPAPIRAMIETAIAGNDGPTVRAVIAVAKKTAPDCVAEIVGLEQAYAHRRAPKVVAAPPPPRWAGQLEVGGSQSTGSSRDLELYGEAKLALEGDRWKQKFAARADYGESAHTPTAERIVVSYQPQLKFDGRTHAYALTEFEHDRFLGYQGRYTVGVGVGVAAIDQPDLKIEIDAGPAFRHVQFEERPTEDQVAARGAITASWSPRPAVKVSEETALYLDRVHTTARSTLALETEIFGPLKTRLSYNVQYERDAPLARHQVDTVTRASLVYGF